MRTALWSLIVVGFGVGSAVGQAPNPAELIERLGSEYVQQATRAYEQLFDAAVQTAQPGREADRASLARTLADAFSQSRGAAARRLLARLLGHIGRDEAVDALAAALTDAEVGDAARRALVINSSPSATRALEKALDGANGERLVGLINALSTRADDSSRRVIALQAGSDDAAVRLAAVEALARFPTERSDAIIARAATLGSERDRRRAWRARLQLAETLLTAEHRTEAIIVFRKARDAAPTPHARRAAMTGLNRTLAGSARTAELGRQNGGLTFRVQRLAVDSNEGCAVADINHDGYLDVIAGPRWYEGPEFSPRPLRDLNTTGEFTDNNGDHAYDVNGDGWADIISGDWHKKEIFWFENPGADGLAKRVNWKAHLLVNGRDHNEAYFFQDLDGDRVPEIIVNCWDTSAPVVAWKILPGGLGGYHTRRHVSGDKGCGHGMAFGDVNGDGREDIVVGKGWYEAPEENPLANPWKFHGGLDLGQCSTPCLVVDVNRDGDADIIYGQGHDYGLAWLEQTKDDSGAIRWEKHDIDTSFAQAHTLVWADLDGDGAAELIAGKRVRGHGGGDPGSADPTCLFRYVWDPIRNAFERYTIAYDNGIGTGMQINIADMNMDGALDIVVAGKTGTYVLINQRLERTASR